MVLALFLMGWVGCVLLDAYLMGKLGIDDKPMCVIGVFAPPVTLVALLAEACYCRGCRVRRSRSP